MDVERFAGQALECLPLPFLALEAVRSPSGSEDLRVLWANPGAQDRFGDGVVGRWLDRDGALGATEPIVPELGPAASRIGLQTVERTVHDAGRTAQLRCTFVPVGDELALTVEDITSEARIRAELVSAGTTLARVEEWGNLGVWELDLRSWETYWSTQVFQILGADEPSPRRFRATVHPDDLPLVDHVVSRAREQPGPYRLTHRIVRGDDEVRTLEQHMQSIAGPDGVPTRLMGTMIDITATQALQDEVRQAQSMRALGVLAGGLAHDFNNVLLVVRGHADLLLNQTGTDDPTRPSLEAISRAGERASTLTRKLMALGRQEELAPAPVSPAKLLAELAELIGPAVASDVRVDVEIVPGTEPVELVADADHLNQLLIDLVLNARDAQAAQVVLRFDVEELDRDDARLEETRLPPGTYGVLQVIDDGQGMNDATLRRAFEPFFTTKDASSGSGLGLANARTFAQRSLGALVAASTPGAGTTMSLLLPIALHAEAADTVPPRRPSQTRVLIAAADAQRSDELTDAVSELGHQLVTVQDVQEMAFSLASEPIDVVVADARLLGGSTVPQIDGIPTVVVGSHAGDVTYPTVAEGDHAALRGAITALLQLA